MIDTAVRTVNLHRTEDELKWEGTGIHYIRNTIVVVGVGCIDHMIRQFIIFFRFIIHLE
jgi:hypothetical protein